MLEKIQKIKVLRAEAMLDVGIDPMIFECHGLLIDMMPTQQKQLILHKLSENKEIQRASS